MLAETDDDLGSLSMPAEESKSVPSPQEDTKSGVGPSESSESQAEAPLSSKGMQPSGGSDNVSQESRKMSAKPQKQMYPLYPSIAQLLHEKGLPTSEAGKIPASGPKGRLLKGDVLAYLGRISSSYPSEQSQRIAKLGHLDLSNIKIAPPPPGAEKKVPESPDPSPSKTSSAIEMTPPQDTEIAVTISLQKVFEVQKRIHSTLGTILPTSTFIARATELANDDLPRTFGDQVSADDLFNDVLGLDQVDSKVSRGHFTPQINALPASEFAKASSTKWKKADIIDILTSGPGPSTSRSSGTSSRRRSEPPDTIDEMNVFSVSVRQGEEKRAKVFLERVKTILQMEPGRLVL